VPGIPLEPPAAARLRERTRGEDVGIRSTMPSRRRRHRDGNARSSRQPAARRRRAKAGSRRGDSVDDAEPEAEHRDGNARSSRHPTLASGERRVAERAGFEPAVRFPVHTLSKRAP
jgi:hypothetical protein